MIREAREARGWSLARVAELSGKSVQTINAIELGESQNPQLSTLMPILAALEIALAKLSPQEVAT